MCIITDLYEQLYTNKLDNWKHEESSRNNLPGLYNDEMKNLSTLITSK